MYNLALLIYEYFLLLDFQQGQRKNEFKTDYEKSL